MLHEKKDIFCDTCGSRTPHTLNRSTNEYLIDGNSIRLQQRGYFCDRCGAQNDLDTIKEANEAEAKNVAKTNSKAITNKNITALVGSKSISTSSDLISISTDTNHEDIEFAKEKAIVIHKSELNKLSNMYNNNQFSELGLLIKSKMDPKNLFNNSVFYLKIANNKFKTYPFILLMYLIKQSLFYLDFCPFCGSKEVIIGNNSDEGLCLNCNKTIT